MLLLLLVGAQAGAPPPPTPTVPMGDGRASGGHLERPDYRIWIKPNDDDWLIPFVVDVLHDD